MTTETTPDQEPGGMNYEAPWHKVIRYAAMPITMPIMAVAFIVMAVKDSIYGSDGNGPP